MERSEKFRFAIAWCAFLYFPILIAERVQSIIRVLVAGGFFASGFDGYVDLLTTLSVLLTVVLLVLFRKEILRPLFVPKAEIGYTRLTIAAGVLLLSGMVHTEYTIAGVQFAAYGVLILALILKTAETAAEERDKLKLWYSLVYLVSYSMAIPVMYHAGITLATLFHVIEAVTATLLVLFFSLMTRRVFLAEARDLLSPIPAAAMAVLDAAILWMRWEEKINTFVLIFASLTALLFLVGKILFCLADKKRSEADS